MREWVVDEIGVEAAKSVDALAMTHRPAGGGDGWSDGLQQWSNGNANACVHYSTRCVIPVYHAVIRVHNIRMLPNVMVVPIKCYFYSLGAGLPLAWAIDVLRGLSVSGVRLMGRRPLMRLSGTAGRCQLAARELKKLPIELPTLPSVVRTSGAAVPCEVALVALVLLVVRVTPVGAARVAGVTGLGEPEREPGLGGLAAAFSAAARR